MTRRPPPALADYCQIDRSLGPADDQTWALRMIAHASDVLDYCYSGRHLDLERWTALWQYIEDWITNKPPSFSPIKFVESDPSQGRIFPDVWFLNDCHGMYRSSMHYVSSCIFASPGLDLSPQTRHLLTTTSCWASISRDLPYIAPCARSTNPNSGTRAK